MKKNISILSIIMISATMAFIAGCKNDDISNPVITLNDDSTLKVHLGESFSDPGGYTATDDKDGDVTANVSASNDVDVNTVGKYSITYSVTDEAGNTGTTSRDVWVYALAVDYENASPYMVTESCTGAIPAYTIDIVALSDTLQIRITNLGDFTAGETTFDATLSGDLNDIITINDTDGSLTANASGTLETGTTTSFNISMSYTFDDGVNPPFTCSDVTIVSN